MDKIISNIDELFPSTEENNRITKMIKIKELQKKDIEESLSSITYLNASITLIALEGKTTLVINYKNHEIVENNISHLMHSQLFKLEKCSENFRCIILFVSREFMEEMDPIEMISTRSRYGIKLYSTPTLAIKKEESLLLQKRIEDIELVLYNSSHFYYKQIVLSAVIAFFMDFSNIVEHLLPNIKNKGTLSRQELLTKHFIELLSANYRHEHFVKFYADKLNVTTHYLTLVVKRITGQSIADFIEEMLYSDSRMLLSKSKLTIQEISMKLNFASQSSFGKFFKRKTGISPFEYRNKTIN